jgi:hypothetical protein
MCLIFLNFSQHKEPREVHMFVDLFLQEVCCFIDFSGLLSWVMFGGCIRICQIYLIWHSYKLQSWQLVDSLCGHSPSYWEKGKKTTYFYFVLASWKQLEQRQSRSYLMEYFASIVALKAMEALLPPAAIHYGMTKWVGQTPIGPGVNFLKNT